MDRHVVYHNPTKRILPGQCFPIILFYERPTSSIGNTHWVNHNTLSFFVPFVDQLTVNVEHTVPRSLSEVDGLGPSIYEWANQQRSLLKQLKFHLSPANIEHAVARR
jgi:hypothetical protein